MTTKRMMSAFVAALLSVCGIVVLTSCQADSESIRTELAAPKTVEVEKTVYVDRDKLVNIMTNVYFDGENMTVNGYKAMTADVNHTLPIIEMAAADHKAAEITVSNELRWEDSNGQTTNGTLTITPSRDNSYYISATLEPASNYSTPKSLHPKVSLITTQHNLKGNVAVIVDDNTQSKDFNFKLNRSYLLVDPSVDTRIINTTDTLIQVEVKTDTIIVEKEVEKVITNTDTIKVEIEKFVRGADINKSVVNDFGFSVGTLTLGDKQLLKVELRHAEPVLNVEEDKLGNVSFTGAGSLVWNGSDSQVTTGTKESNNVTIKSFDYVRNEYNKISENMVIVRTIYIVKGSFYNENNDLIEFSMELAPSYLQKVEATPQPQVEDKPMYRGIIRKVTAEGLKLMTKPVVQQLVDGQWKDIRTCSRSCIGMSGSPSGLDLYVKSTKVVEENEDSWWYKATGNDVDKTWIGDDTKSDGTIVTKETKVYQFNHLFTADAVAEGKVGPATQLYLMRATKVQVLDPDGNALVCTWEDGTEFSLSLNAKINDTEFVEKAEMKGQTKVMSDKTYEYAISFVQHFSSSIGGYELQNVDATSTLWIAK